MSENKENKKDYNDYCSCSCDPLIDKGRFRTIEEINKNANRGKRIKSIKNFLGIN